MGVQEKFERFAYSNPGKPVQWTLRKDSPKSNPIEMEKDGSDHEASLNLLLNMLEAHKYNAKRFYILFKMHPNDNGHEWPVAVPREFQNGFGYQQAYGMHGIGSTFQQPAYAPQNGGITAEEARRMVDDAVAKERERNEVEVEKMKQEWKYKEAMRKQEEKLMGHIGALEERLNKQRTSGDKVLGFLENILPPEVVQSIGGHYMSQMMMPKGMPTVNGPSITEQPGEPGDTISVADETDYSTIVEQALNVLLGKGWSKKDAALVYLFVAQNSELMLANPAVKTAFDNFKNQHP
jgi:hypothetical protein